VEFPLSPVRPLTILGVIVIGILSRLLPHPPNCTAMNAIALFGVFFLGNRWISLGILLSTLIFSDFVFGFHATLPFVYLSFGLIFLMGCSLRKASSWLHITALCFAASLLFFLITNFGVWLSSPMYPKTWSGLGLCYFAAIPFFANQFFGDVAYAGLLCAYMSFAKAWSKPKIWA